MICIKLMVKEIPFLVYFEIILVLNYVLNQNRHPSKWEEKIIGKKYKTLQA